MVKRKYASLYEALLGERQSVQQVLDEASRDIGELSERNKGVSFRAIHRAGVSCTRLYDFRAAREKSSA